MNTLKKPVRQAGRLVAQDITIQNSADTFGVFNPSSVKLEPVFFVENGQVFINEAFINEAVINKATIEKIIVGSDLRSKNYDPVKRVGSRIGMINGIVEIYSSRS
ncbi:DUF1983 domain-containing protein [Providencia rettgeri]|uniref:phage tail tip fiber protein n=1 Tax=Providencia rettgeri TaxID=587 RepID=UPI0034E0C129